MPIKRIQLRGISRTPSDRMVEDGGCAESLNVQLDDNELVPVVAPKPQNVTEAEPGMFPSNAGYEHPWECIYIHKGPSFTKAILVYDGNICLYNGGTYGDERDFTVIHELRQGESVKSVTSIGNMLVVATDEQTIKMLYKAETGQYVDYGASISLPAMEVVPNYYGPQNATLHYDAADLDSEEAYALQLIKEDWEIESFAPDSPRSKVYLKSAEIVRDIKAQKDQLDQAIKKYSYPVFVKYSLVLTDGTEVLSDPYLMAPQDSEGLLAEGAYDISLAVDPRLGTADFYVRSGYYDIFFQMPTSKVDELIARYGDMIRGFRFYVSEDIRPATPNTFSKARISEKSPAGSRISAQLILGEPYSNEDFDKIGNFYLVKSMTLQEFGSAPSVVIPWMNNTDRAVQPRPQVSVYNPRDIFSSEIVTNYNGRLLLGGVKQELSLGPRYYPYILRNATGTKPVSVWYFINKSMGARAVVRGVSFDATYTIGSYLTYPNASCTRAIVRTGSAGDYRYYSVNMHEHPFQDMAYYANYEQRDFVALLDGIAAETLTDQNIEYLGTTAPSEIADLDENSNVIRRDNDVLLSSLYNPFVLEQGQSFPDRVLGLAPLTKPLSTGQVGDFAIYVFTEGGIQSIGITKLGEFGQPSFVSGDVCIRPNMIRQLDQAILFLADRGLMLLTGSDILCLTDHMRGEPYNIVAGTELASILAGSPWKDLLDTMQDPDVLMQFLKSDGAAIAYDYAGRRVICFSPGKGYAYTYHFATQTWHKIFIDGGEGYRFNKVLNAYPSAWVALQRIDEEEERHRPYATKVLDYSTFLDELAEESMKATVITRPFDLGETDVRKVIKDIRIRGQYSRGDVKYLLLGSMDGKQFNVLRSLRGASYKSFRLVLLADLQPNDRISWIDIGYETRFTNKLR